MKAKDNPFSVERILKIEYRLSAVEWENLINTLEKYNFSAAIIGPHGSGKTTLLETLAKKLSLLNYNTERLQLNTDSPTFPKGFLNTFSRTLNKNDIVLLDGAEQLALLYWQYFRYKIQKAKGLIITTHNPEKLPTLYKCQTNYELLDDILFELIGEQAIKLKESNRKLFDKHQGNIRDCLREYYDIYAQMP